MGGKNGGTQIFCPHCKQIRVCRAIPPGQFLDERSQRLHYTTHPDINFFRRGRECLHCSSEFLTAEVEEGFLDELIQLRNALADIKKNAASYQAEAKAAEKSLKLLTGSLEVLKALK